MLKTLAKAVTIVYGLYLALCLLLLLPALNVLAPRLVQEHTGRVLHSELLLFNPFSLAADLRGVALLDLDGNTFLSFERLRLNLSLASLWQPGVVLDDITLRGLGVDVRRFEDGGFNFDDLVPPADEEAAGDAEAAGGIPALTIHRVSFGAHHLRFSDATRTPVYRSEIEDIDLSARSLSTVRNPAGDYRFSLHTPQYGRLDWRGELSLAAAHSEGYLELAEMDLRPIHRYFAQDLDFALDSARLDISGRYTADWSGEPAATVDEGALRLHGVTVSPARPEALPDTLISLAALAVTGISATTLEQRVQVAEIHVDAPSVAGFSEGDTHSLLALFGVAPAEDQGDADSADSADGRDSTDAARATETGPASSGGTAAQPDWSVAVDRVRLTQGRVHWRSAYTAPALSRVAPIEMELAQLGWPAQEASTLSLQLGLNSVATLSVEGDIHPGTGAGSLDISLEQLPLSTFDPALAMASNATLSSGTLATQLGLELEAFAPTRVSADTAVAGVEVGIRGLRDNALGWEQLRVSATDIDLPNRVASLGSVELSGWHSRLHILEDGRINVELALTDTAAPATDAASTDDAADTRETPPATATEADPLGGWTVRSEGVALNDLRIDFRDDSMPLPFNTEIVEINGTIGAIDSATGARTPVRIRGSADGYAPVALDGEIAPLAAQTALDLGLSFSGLDIARFSPYSVTYAGRRIDAGTLNLDVRYQLEGSALRGDNHAVISQMQLGEKVESEKALDLPLQLALALLTDARGVIDLDIPVSGDVDNPSFSLGKVIGGAIRNLITKAVTAPFRLLAGLVGSDRDLEHIAFEPGGTNAQAQAAIEDLSKALAQRPQLRIVATGFALPEVDLPPLKYAQLERELIEAGLDAASVAARDAAWADAIAARYAALASPSTTGTEAEGTAGEPPAPPTLQEQLERVLDAIVIPDAALRELAATRASAFKRALVERGGIAADRVSLRAPEVGGEDALAGVLLDVAS